MSLGKLSRVALACVIFGGAAGLVEVSSGCDVGTCDRSDEDNPLADYKAGTVSDGIYMSSPWNQGLLYFPGGARIRFFHHLGVVPTIWNAYLSFHDDGTASGPLAPGDGNSVELHGTPDADSITLKNNSCAPFYVLLTAQGGAASATSSSSSASP